MDSPGITITRCWHCEHLDQVNDRFGICGKYVRNDLLDKDAGQINCSENQKEGN